MILMLHQFLRFITTTTIFINIIIIMIITIKAEQEALLNSLRKDMKALLDSREEALKRVQELEENKIKSEVQLNKVVTLTEQVELLQSTIDDKQSLITRLRSEAQTNEKNHAMRTALLATAEAQLEALKAEMLAKEDTVKEAVERVTVLQARVAGAETRLEERVKESNSRIESLEKERDDEKQKYNDTIQSTKKQYEQENEAIKKDFAKKSALARTLMSEKEEEARVLSLKVSELKAEISSGAPSERRIFELAQVQAKRDASYSMYSDTREIAFQQLQATLAARDLDLARLQQSHAGLVTEVQELRRTMRREGVNMDYLKNIVLQYMSFPMQSPERISLVPVISTLLQFNPKEIAVVQVLLLLLLLLLLS